MNTSNFYGAAERFRSHISPVASGLLALAPYTVAITIAYLFYANILPHFRPYAWVDDWIYARPLEFTTLQEWWVWLWQQHVDHRIPIQKLTNFFILSWSGFDYRWLVGVNFLMALISAAFLVEAARVYRGRRSVGDVAIPFIVLNFGMGYTQWGFHFQFTSSILCLSGFLLATLLWLRSQRNVHAFLAVFSLTIACLTGMNGVLPALGAGIAFTAWAIWRWKPFGTVFLFAVPMIIASHILASWTAYAGSDQSSVSAYEFFDYAIGLTTGSFAFFLQRYETLARVVVISLMICAMTSLVFRLNRRQLDDADLLVGACLAIYVCLLAAISYGRAKIQGGWEPGSAIHYGVLTIFVPILSWILVSKNAPKYTAELLGAILLTIGMWVFQVNGDTRMWYINYNNPLQAKTLKDLASEKPIDEIAKENITQFHAGMPGIHEVTDGIVAFRKAHAELYGGKP